VFFACFALSHSPDARLSTCAAFIHGRGDRPPRARHLLLARKCLRGEIDNYELSDQHLPKLDFSTFKPLIFDDSLVKAFRTRPFPRLDEGPYVNAEESGEVSPFPMSVPLFLYDIRTLKFVQGTDRYARSAMRALNRKKEYASGCPVARIVAQGFSFSLLETPRVLESSVGTPAPAWPPPLFSGLGLRWFRLSGT